MLVGLLAARAGAQAVALPAQPRAETADAGYDAAIDQALSEYEAHNFEEALALFNQAHALSPNARTLRGMAMAEYELRRYVASLTHLQEALASQVRPITGDLRVLTEEFLRKAQQYVSRVVVKVTPEEARPRITVDGAAVTLPADGALLLRAGERVLEVQAEGFVPERRSVLVQGGEDQRLSFTLRLPAAPGGAPAEAPPPARSVWKSPWLWTGVGAVVLGGTVVALLATQRGGTTTAAVYQGNVSAMQGPGK